MDDVDIEPDKYSNDLCCCQPSEPHDHSMIFKLLLARGKENQRLYDNQNEGQVEYLNKVGMIESLNLIKEKCWKLYSIG